MSHAIYSVNSILKLKEKNKDKKCHPDLQGLGVHDSAVQTRLNLAEIPPRVGNHTEPVLPSPRDLHFADLLSSLKNPIVCTLY